MAQTEKKRKYNKSKYILYAARIGFWVSTGAILSIFFVSSFSFLFFEKINEGRIYPGIIASEKNLGGKTQKEAESYFLAKNEKIDTNFTLLLNNTPVATVSAKDIDFGYDERLLASQAMSLGRSRNILSDIYIISKAYVSGVYLPPAYRYSQEKLMKVVSPFLAGVEKQPVDALFSFENGKVIAFKPSSDGQKLDRDKLDQEILGLGVTISTMHPNSVTIPIPIKTIKPKITTESVNNFGIKELIASGTSTFYHSIQSRIYNIGLAASRMNGILVAPDEVFSFNKALGDVTSLTGYQQAYVIQNGKTVLGDGGGVCQVSTTFFRALLNAGLPIVERHPHSYRVGYYEQDSPPGLDATIYYPSVDLKFRNDTEHYILIQTAIDYDNLRLTFYLYGTRDGREVSISNSVITNRTPALPPLYQDDPTLPKGVVKQVDFEAAGADVYFTREVRRNGRVVLADKFVSNYQPWQAIFLRGTQ